MIPVLVADDDQSIRETIRLVLEDAGYPVEEALTGADVLARASATRGPLVVLLDHHMPQMSGLEVLQAVARDPALQAQHAYVLMTASPRLIAGEQHGLASGMAVAVLAKPFDIETLLAVVERSCQQLNHAS